jgi:hypothetical protein
MIFFMNRFLATALLFGYVLLVPFCFFGGAMSADMSTMETSGAHPHEMVDCCVSIGEPMHSTDAGVMGMIAHHFGMYNSFAQTPLAAILIAVVAVFLLVAFGLPHAKLRVVLARSSLRLLVQRSDEPRSRSPQYLLTWLSLFESSPTFA